VHGDSLYEERVVVIEAPGEDEALSLAEAEAEAYCEGLTNCRSTGFYQSYAMNDGAVGSGVEVFSLIRESQLTPTEYLDRFFDTGDERERHFTE
jgi:hypothetical protein